MLHLWIPKVTNSAFSDNLMMLIKLLLKNCGSQPIVPNKSLENVSSQLDSAKPQTISMHVLVKRVKVLKLINGAFLPPVSVEWGKVIEWESNSQHQPSLD